MERLSALDRGLPDIGALLVGYALLGLQPMSVRLLSMAGFGSAESAIARFLFGGILIIAICLHRGRGLETGQPWFLLLRGILGGVSVLLYFYSVQETGAARATLLNYTYPFFANVFSVLLGARIRKIFWLLLGIASFGVGLLLMQDDFGTFSLGRGELAGLASGFVAGGSILTLKKLRDTDESLTILAAFTVVGIAFSLPFVRWNQPLPALSLRIWWLIAAVGATSFFGHMFFTRGYRGVPLTTASALALLVPAASTLLGALILGEPLSKYSWVGALLVLVSLGLVPRVTGSSEGPSEGETARPPSPLQDPGIAGDSARDVVAEN